MVSTEPTANTQLFLWVAVGDPGAPPQRIRVESCVDCAALVPVARFDTHGAWHRNAHSPKP